MEEENLSVKEAALAAGYQNLNHFYKYFNEQYPNLINKGYFTDVDDDTMRLGTFYYAGGIYYILRQWLTEPINKTPQEVAVLMCHFLNVD